MAEEKVQVHLLMYLVRSAGDCVCRYNELMFIIDTCQAASMFTTFYSPNIVATGSSSVNEDSLSVSCPFSWLS